MGTNEKAALEEVLWRSIGLNFTLLSGLLYGRGAPIICQTPDSCRLLCDDAIPAHKAEWLADGLPAGRIRKLVLGNDQSLVLHRLGLK